MCWTDVIWNKFTAECRKWLDSASAEICHKTQVFTNLRAPYMWCFGTKVLLHTRDMIWRKWLSRVLPPSGLLALVLPCNTFCLRHLQALSIAQIPRFGSKRCEVVGWNRSRVQLRISGDGGHAEFNYNSTKWQFRGGHNTVRCSGKSKPHMDVLTSDSAKAIRAAMQSHSIGFPLPLFNLASSQVLLLSSFCIRTTLLFACFHSFLSLRHR